MPGGACRPPAGARHADALRSGSGAIAGRQRGPHGPHRRPEGRPAQAHILARGAAQQRPAGMGGPRAGRAGDRAGRAAALPECAIGAAAGPALSSSAGGPADQPVPDQAGGYRPDAPGQGRRADQDGRPAGDPDRQRPGAAGEPGLPIVADARRRSRERRLLNGF